MKITVTKPVTIEVKELRMSVAVRFDEEEMPSDFPGRNGDSWGITVDLDTKKIKDWPDGFDYELFLKVCDCGSYWLYDDSGNVVAALKHDYVPNGVVPGEYGDYISLSIAKDGTIRNWPREPDFSEFFPEDYAKELSRHSTARAAPLRVVRAFLLVYGYFFYTETMR